jgi:transcription antitermination factor NusA-like protein
MATRAPKRTLDESSEENVDKKTKVAEDPDAFEVRCLIQNSQVGTIIGKGGSNIRGVRDECKVFISILKAPEGVRERVMTIKGHTDNIALALHRIGGLLVQASQQRREKTGENTTQESKHDFKAVLLVHSSLVGGVIGKGGALVQATQSSTGARVQVSTEPLQQSSEKSITISGELDSIHAAAQLVVAQLKENELRPGVQNYPYTPSPYYGGQGPPHYQQGAYGAPQQPYGHFQGYAPQGYGGPGGPPQAHGYGPSSYGRLKLICCTQTNIRCISLLSARLIPSIPFHFICLFVFYSFCVLFRCPHGWSTRGSR